MFVAIVSSLKQVPEELWSRVRGGTQFGRCAVFGAAVIQGVLSARQLFGASGLSQWYPFTSVQITHAIKTILSADHDSSDRELQTDTLCSLLSKVSMLIQVDHNVTWMLSKPCSECHPQHDLNVTTP